MAFDLNHEASFCLAVLVDDCKALARSCLINLGTEVVLGYERIR